MTQNLADAEILFEENASLERILTTPSYSEIGYLVEVDLKYPEKMKQKTKYLQFCPD